MDDRIGKSHMMVPGPDREFGFGGMCLPKDTLAFATSASRKGSPLKLLEEAILINKEIR
jgi:UDP-glucose 6-dehydrogenase